jgi:hypothetical protein
MSIERISDLSVSTPIGKIKAVVELLPEAGSRRVVRPATEH